MTSNTEYTLELLVKHGMITPSDAQDARERALHPSPNDDFHGPVEFLIKNGFITPMDVLRAEADEAGVLLVQHIDVIPQTVINCIPVALARKLHVVPLVQQGDVLRVAIRNPFNFDAIDLLAREISYTVEACCCS